MTRSGMMRDWGAIRTAQMNSCLSLNRVHVLNACNDSAHSAPTHFNDLKNNSANGQSIANAWNLSDVVQKQATQRVVFNALVVVCEFTAWQIEEITKVIDMNFTLNQILIRLLGWSNCIFLIIELIANLADNLFKNIFHGHDTTRPAILI